MSWSLVLKTTKIMTPTQASSSLSSSSSTEKISQSLSLPTNELKLQASSLLMMSAANNDNDNSKLKTQQQCTANMSKRFRVNSLLASPFPLPLVTIPALLIAAILLLANANLTHQVSVINSAPATIAVKSTPTSLSTQRPHYHQKQQQIDDTVGQGDYNGNLGRAQHSLNYLLSVISEPQQQQQQQQSPGDNSTSDGGDINSDYSRNNNNSSSSSSKTTGDRGSSRVLHELRELLIDEKHDHSSDKINIGLANEAWKLMRSNAQSFAQEKVDEARPIINGLLVSSSISGQCRQSISHLLDHLKNLDLWAIQMWNAWGDFPAQGLFEGTFTSMGSYHGCVDTRPNEFIGEAQYCTINYQPIIPKRPRYHNILAGIPDLGNFTQEQDVFNYFARKAQYFYYTKLRLATCLPTKCSKLDIESLAKTVGSKAILQYSGVECLKREPQRANGAQKFAIGVLLLLAVVSLLGTISHLFNIEQFGQEWSYTPAIVKRFLSCMMHFSMLRNVRKLFATSQTSSNRANDISCIHGLRFLTISWIIFGHTMQYTEWAGFGRIYQIEQNLVAFAIQPLLNATFSVDTFFLISGLLTTYVTWQITKGDYERFNKGAFIVSRYLRLTPQVLLVTLLFIVFPLMGEGPYWKGLIQKESDRCQSNWWINALYLQAFFKSDQICNLVTWWLSIEMFYHLVSIFVILALLKSRAKGMMLALVMGSSFTMVSFYLHFLNYYPPNMLPTLPQRYEIWHSIVRKFFWTPYPHAAAYFVGLALGFVLYTRCVKKLTNGQVRNGWILFSICYATILWGTYGWNKNEPYSRLVSSVYYHACQVLWALATGWAILACVLGRGGWLNQFLSLPIFIPLGRATYMTYLAHMLVVMSYPASMNLLIEPSYLTFVYIFVSNLVFSNVLGITLTIVYESPILHLQKLILSNMANKLVEPIAETDDEKDPSKTAALITATAAAATAAAATTDAALTEINHNHNYKHLQQQRTGGATNPTKQNRGDSNNNNNKVSSSNDLLQQHRQQHQMMAA